MPSKKQRRRRDKERRHEYEYVYVDHEGKEVEAPAEAETKPAKGSSSNGRAGAAAGGSGGKGTRKPRAVPPPSWKKAALFGGAFAVLMIILGAYGKNPQPLETRLLTGIAYGLLIGVFWYAMQTLLYRSYRKRIGDPLPPRGGRRTKTDGSQKS
jgi:hypothetical protein